MTVARASEAERSLLVERLGLPVVTSEDLRSRAEALAAERSADRAAARARLDSAAARLGHDAGTARSRLEHLQNSRRGLLDGATWARSLVHQLPEHVAAVEAARDVLEARQADQRSARAALDRVLEQRAAAGVAMEEADRELAELVGVGMDESALRRELEAAGRTVRDAQEAHTAAVARLQALEAERDELDRRRKLLGEETEAGDTRPTDDGLVARLVRALARWHDEACFGETDPRARALADAFSDLSVDLADVQRRCGPPPDPAALAAAHAARDAAAARLAELDARPVVALSPAARAEIDAAHARVLDAQDRLSRRFGAAAARRRFEEAVAAEEALLARHGFTAYLQVVLTGGRTSGDEPERIAAERAYLHATAELDRAERAAQRSPEEVHLDSERARLLAHACDLLGVDPGEQLIDLLWAHPSVSADVVADLKQALAVAGVHPVGVSLVDAAQQWLADHAIAIDAGQPDALALRVIEERGVLAERSRDIVEELTAARQAEVEAAARLEAASRSVGTFETELTVRAGEDEQRLARFAAAEQLRGRVEALAATLARAESDALSALERASEDVTGAEVALDAAEALLTDAAATARSLASELPIDRRPVGDPLTTLEELALRLVAHAEVLDPEVAAAGAAASAATERALHALAEASAAPTGAEIALADDVRDAWESLLDEAVALRVLDDPFVGLEASLRAALLDRALERSATAPLVVLTDQPEVLGWAIELPDDRGAVVAARSLLDLDLSDRAPSAHHPHSELDDPARRRVEHC